MGGGWGEKGMGRREEEGGEQGCRTGSGGPGFPERPNDPDVQLQRDGCFGNCKSPAFGGPSLGQGEAGRGSWRERRGEAESERTGRKGNVGELSSEGRGGGRGRSGGWVSGSLWGGVGGV